MTFIPKHPLIKKKQPPKGQRVVDRSKQSARELSAELADLCDMADLGHINITTVRRIRHLAVSLGTDDSYRTALEGLVLQLARVYDTIALSAEGFPITVNMPVYYMFNSTVCHEFIVERVVWDKDLKCHILKGSHEVRADLCYLDSQTAKQRYQDYNIVTVSAMVDLPRYYYLQHKVTGFVLPSANNPNKVYAFATMQEAEDKLSDLLRSLRKKKQAERLQDAEIEQQD